MLRRPVWLLLFAAACHDPIILTDNVDVTWDFKASPEGVELHTPYVRGARVTLIVTSPKDNEDFDCWNVVSEDPGVFLVDGCETRPEHEDERPALECHGRADREGVAALVVRDGLGLEVGGGRVEVVVPDRAVLEAHGPLILGREAEAAVDEVRLLAGGKATYHVRYLGGGRELHGNGVLSAAVPAGVVATPSLEFLSEAREWLTFEAGDAGARSFELFADDASLGMYALATVPDGSIERLGIETQSEAGRREGEGLVALAQAYDRADRRIFGANIAWDLDGVEQLGDGDLFRYKFEHGRFRDVTAKRGSLTGSATIQASSGFVDSSSEDDGGGCSASSGGSLLGGIGLAGLIAARRRRRSRRVA